MTTETKEPMSAVTEETLVPAPVSGRAAEIVVTKTGVMLRSLEDLMRFARMAVSGGAAPKGMTEGQAAVAIQAGLERGLGPLGGLTQCVVINGVLSWRGQGAVALIRNSPVCKPGSFHSWVEGDGDDRKGVAVAHRVGDRDPSRREFSVKDAKRAGLWNKQGPWHDYPDGQLEWRAVGLLARRKFEDVVGGFPLAEEAVDFDARSEQTQPTQSPKLADLPPPQSPDPLLDAIEGKVVVTEPASITPETAAAETESAKEEESPFASHLEADRELADAEKKAEARSLFDEAR